MRSVDAIEQEKWETEIEIERLRDRLDELRDERVEVEDGQPCPDCDGEGQVACEVCNGIGSIRVHSHEDYGVSFECDECNDCLGAGTVECARCNGEGRIDW
jgi:DnaJ-class molecular chaperone